jgi:diadenosine tetraphosphate (Ap4A) HIT family hydrolase
MDDDCWFCDELRDGDTPPGGWLTTYDGWRAGHVPGGWGPVGTVVLETVEHHESFADLPDELALGFTRLLGRTQAAVCEVTGADRAYVWATMDRHKHLHVWVVPWPADHALRGPRYLAEVLTFAEGAPDDAAAERAAGALRERLSARLSTASATSSGPSLR